MHSLLKTPLAAAVAVKFAEEVDDTSGVCGNIENYQEFYTRTKEEGSHAVGRLAKTWPYYSGSRYYPVPSTLDGLNAECCFGELLITEGLWAGEAGDLRWDLLNHVLDHLTLEAGIY